MNDQSSDAQPVAGASPARRPGIEAPDALALQRVGAMVEIPPTLRQMNVDPDELLASLGLAASALSDIDGKLPFPVVSDLVLKCVEATGRADFPLIVGAASRLDHLGIIGSMLSTAPDFGSALTEFVANHPRYVRGATAYLVDCGEDAILLGHRVHHPGLRGSAIFSAGAVAFGRMIFVELCGAEPVRVLLSIPKPDDVSPYKRTFGRARLVFEAEHFGLIYARSALSRPAFGAHPARHAEIRKFIAERWNSLQPDILDRVMRVLVPSVLAGTPSLERTANLLVMHPRTLNRALQARGLTFRDTVNEARFEMASQLLRDTHFNIGDLAQMLGYSEASAFTRFFTSMSGLSPSDWRKRQLVEADAKHLMFRS